MDFNNVLKKFKERKAKSITKLKKSAVVIPLIEKEGELHILFEVRAFSMKKQPGDICLPGGRVEENESYIDAAHREICEELSISKEQVEMIGEGDFYINPYGNIIYSFVAILKTDEIRPEPQEVDHVFTVPLKFFLENEPLCHIVKIASNPGENFPYHLIRGGKEYKFFSAAQNQYFYNYKQYNIWGITAAIIKRFVDVLKEE